MLLPRPSTDDSSNESDSDSEGDVDYNEKFDGDDAAGVYQDWLCTVERDDQKMMALMFHDNYVESFGLTKSTAAAEVGLLLGYNEKTIRLWWKDFIGNKGEFSEYRRGRYTHYIVLDDETYRDKTLEWV